MSVRLKNLLGRRLHCNPVKTYKIIDNILSYGHMISYHIMFTKENICLKNYLEIQTDLELRDGR